MLGQKSRHFRSHPSLTLKKLVPANHFYRELEAKLDLEFVRELVAHHYAKRGRPSIDPVVFFKLQLIMFFEGIRSERQLMKQVQVNDRCRAGKISHIPYTTRLFLFLYW